MNKLNISAVQLQDLIEVNSKNNDKLIDYLKENGIIANNYYFYVLLITDCGNQIRVCKPQNIIDKECYSFVVLCDDFIKIYFQLIELNVYQIDVIYDVKESNNLTSFIIESLDELYCVFLSPKI